MAEDVRMHAGPLKLSRAQALMREKVRLQEEIRRADAEIAALEEERARWQVFHKSIERLYAPEGLHDG